MNAENPIIQANGQTEPRVWEPRPGWVAITAESPLTCFHKDHLDWFETGVMTKQGKVGVTQSACLVIHFKSGTQTGIPTKEPVKLMELILEAITEKVTENG